jgi:hypothetical protein
MSVKGFKLITGEEIVAEIVQDNGDVLYIKNPLASVLQRGQNGPQLGFMPWLAFAEGPIKIKNEHIISVVDLDNEIKNQYNSIFGSGIMTPTKQLIT